MAENAVGNEYCCAYLPVSPVLRSLTLLFNPDPIRVFANQRGPSTLYKRSFENHAMGSHVLLQNNVNMALSFSDEKGKLHTVVTFKFQNCHTSRTDDNFVETSRPSPNISSEPQANSVTRIRNDCMNEPSYIRLFISRWVGTCSVISNWPVSTGTYLRT